jgi:hypothetical protein
MPSTHTQPATFDEDLDDEPPPIKRWVKAADQPLPRTSGFVSVFDLAAMSLHMRPLSLFGHRPARTGDEAVRIQDAIHIEIERYAGHVKVRRLHHTETQAWHDQEVARRARQRPPRPSAKVKTKSRKFAALIGVGA